MKNEIIIGMSGASGIQYGIRLLEAIKQMKGFETHLVISESAKQLIKLRLIIRSGIWRIWEITFMMIMISHHR